MQYASTIASSSPGRKTMAAKVAPAINEPLMGQRNGMSESDVEAVKRMYCQPGKGIRRGQIGGEIGTTNLAYQRGRDKMSS